MGGYIFILILLVGMWFLLIRPQRRRQMEARRLVQSLAVGKEIVTAGGLYGTITALEHLGSFGIFFSPLYCLRLRALRLKVLDLEPKLAWAVP